MKIKEAIEMANLMEQGNVLPRELAILFLAELDGMIQSDIMLHAPEEIVSYTDEEQELLLMPPHDKLYVHYLVMMIRNQQQEYEGYQNSQAAVDEKIKTFRRWYVQHYRPADTASRSYTGGTSADAFGFAYLTAYGLAVKHGYGGTEEEWLESLHGEAGDPGDPARMRYDEAQEMIQWGVGEVWYDLFGLQELRDPAVAAFLAEAEEYRDQAKAAAAAADKKAQAAQHYAQNASDAAVSAEQSAETAAGAAGAARDAAANAAAYAEDAQTQAETAGNYAQIAEAAAERAENAQGSGGIAEESDPTVPEWAKQAQKPNYTAEEVGAEAAGTVAGSIQAHDTGRYAHNDIRQELQTLADRLSTATLGRHTDGLLYLFVGGRPVGSGVELPVVGIDGYITEDKQIVFANLPDGEYTLAYVMEDGSIAPLGELVKDSNVYYSITSTLTNCTSSNSAEQVAEGSSYTATITADIGYELESVIVTMGGVDVSATAVSGGTITIEAVTGDIVITAVAKAMAISPSYTNLADPASADWQEGYRLSISSGTTSELAGHTVTNYIPLAAGDVLRVKGMIIAWGEPYTGTNDPKILYCREDKSKIGGLYGSTTIGTPQNGYGTKVAVDGDVSTYTPMINNNGEQMATASMAYIRIDGVLMDGFSKDDVVITINEPIA